MILIADSGSTKCEWALTTDYKTDKISTDGINPIFCSKKNMENIVAKQLIAKLGQHAVEQIHFFGAGCIGEKKKEVADCLKTFFPEAKIYVESDMVGAAVALFGNKKGIACIMGTGSNSCFYNGQKVVKNISPLGYIIGDEGSGAVLGKKFLGDCLKNQIPQKITNQFFKNYQLTTSDIIENVYKKPFPNRFLAQFSYFIKEHISEPYFYNLVFDSFTEFYVKNVMQYDNFNEYPVSFCGSIAYHFADVLEVAAYECELNFGKVVQSPIDELLKHYNTTPLC